jgi:hypothetical protein
MPVEKTRSRKTVQVAIAFGGAVFISLMFLMYAFIQKGQAAEARRQAVAAEVQVRENRHRAEAGEEQFARLTDEMKACSQIVQQKDSIIKTLRNGRR